MLGSVKTSVPFFEWFFLRMAHHRIRILVLLPECHSNVSTNTTGMLVTVAPLDTLLYLRAIVRRITARTRIKPQPVQ